MDVKTLILGENNRIKGWLELVCSDLTDEQVVYEHDAVDERGIGNIVSHLYSGLGNRARLDESLNEEADLRTNSTAPSGTSSTARRARTTLFSIPSP